MDTGAVVAGSVDGGDAAEGAVPKELGFEELGFEEAGWTGLCAGQRVEASSNTIPAVNKRGVMGHLRQRFLDYTSGAA